MASPEKQEMLRKLPSVTALLETAEAAAWMAKHPRPLVTECLRQALEARRQQLLSGIPGTCAAALDETKAVLARALSLLETATEPRIRGAINATGIILHTGLGRAVFSDSVVDSVARELKGYVTLATDRATGERAERDELVEPILTELTGAEAATVVNNNAAATMLVLAALAAHREVIVSRGQLIEIGGSFRLPEVMAQSQAKLVEVGATNRTHVKDYNSAITENTAAIMRVHPSNFRVIGFTKEVSLPELATLAHARGLLLIDDLGAGSLTGLEAFGLPHEPTVQESIAAGADVVLFSADKLIGGSQGGIIVGRRAVIDRLRRHPLMRALRADKTCLMILERTLHLFRDADKLRRENPTYRMIATSREELEKRAALLKAEIAKAAPLAEVSVVPARAYLGSGSLPQEALLSFVVTVNLPGLSADAVARGLRMDSACVFGRIENDRVCLDARTITDAEVPLIAQAIGRIAL